MASNRASNRTYNRLYICQTCERERPPVPGELSRGRQLADAVTVRLAESPLAGRLTLLRVTCLSGCLNPCNVAFRGARKCGLRFSRLQAGDADAVVAFAARYIDAPTGDVPESKWPDRLQGKRTAYIPVPPRRD